MLPFGQGFPGEEHRALRHWAAAGQDLPFDEREELEIRFAEGELTMEEYVNRLQKLEEDHE
jgi:hypothetical protein